jgi:hypothetical protein
MRKLILETDEWMVHKDEEKQVLIVSYFEEGHFKNDIFIPYQDIGIPKEGVK